MIERPTRTGYVIFPTEEEAQAFVRALATWPAPMKITVTDLGLKVNFTGSREDIGMILGALGSGTRTLWVANQTGIA